MNNSPLLLIIAVIILAVLIFIQLHISRKQIIAAKEKADQVKQKLIR